MLNTHLTGDLPKIPLSRWTSSGCMAISVGPNQSALGLGAFEICRLSVCEYSRSYSVLPFILNSIPCRVGPYILHIQKPSISRYRFKSDFICSHLVEMWEAGYTL